MKRMLWYHLLTLMVMTGELLFLASCEKNAKDPTVATLPASQITYCSATVGGISEGAGVIGWGVCFDTTPNPIYSIYLPTNYESFSGGGLGSHTTTHSGLIENTTYYLRAYVEYYKSLNGQLPQGMTSYGSEVTFKTQKLETIIVFNPNLTYESLSDIEGNTYKTIQIGTQVWMAENLRVTKYRDGSTIQKISDNWGFSDTIGAYCNYGNNATYVTTFGRLYTCYATVNSHKLCPTGWHVPYDAEWTLLETYLGGTSVADGKLKEVGTSHWESPNTDATNESGFTALPGGSRYLGNFYDLGSTGFWLIPTNLGYRYRSILYIDSNVSNIAGPIADRAGDCYSVRCVKD